MESFNVLRPMPAKLHLLPLVQAVSWQTSRLFLQKALPDPALLGRLCLVVLGSVIPQRSGEAV